MIKLNKTQVKNSKLVNEILIVNTQSQIEDIKKNVKNIFNYCVLAQKNDFSNEFFSITMPVLTTKNNKGKLIRNRNCSFKNYPTFFKAISENEKIVLSKEFQKSNILGFDGLYKFIQKTNKPKIENSKSENSKSENVKSENSNSEIPAIFSDTTIDFESLVVVIQDSFDNGILDNEDLYSLKTKIDFMLAEKNQKVFDKKSVNQK